MSSRLGQAALWANLWRKPIPNALSRSTGSPRNSRWPYSSPVRRFAWPRKPLLGRLNSAWRVRTLPRQEDLPTGEVAMQAPDEAAFHATDMPMNECSNDATGGF
ncbi:hypothetical protein E4U11_000394 [Claviceps purpurea]|nr:hypothetical protein E4U11_000394 [Claviceps purpurea]